MKVKKVNEFFKPFSKPIVKEKGAGCSTPFYYRICISLIAERLPSGSACFLFKTDSIKIKKFFVNIIINITAGNKIPV